MGEINGVFSDFPQSIIDELLNGNAVKIDGLGTFKLKVQGKSQKEKKDVTSAGEKEFRFVEVPTDEGKQDADEEGGDTPMPTPAPTPAPGGDGEEEGGQN